MAWHSSLCQEGMLYLCNPQFHEADRLWDCKNWVQPDETAKLRRRAKKRNPCASSLPFSGRGLSVAQGTFETWAAVLSPVCPSGWRVIHNLMFLRPRNSETRVQGGEADGHAATKPWTWLLQLPHCIILTVYGDGPAHWGFPQGSCDSAIAGKDGMAQHRTSTQGALLNEWTLGTLGTNTNGEERMLLYPCLLCHLTQCPDIVLCRGYSHRQEHVLGLEEKGCRGGLAVPQTRPFHLLTWHLKSPPSCQVSGVQKVYFNPY